MAFGADHVQAAQSLDAFAEFDVGAATGHIGGDGDGSFLTGACDDFRLLLVVLRVEDAVDDAVFLEHPGDEFADLDRHGAHQNGTALSMDVLNLSHHGVVFLSLGLIDRVVLINADTGPVGGDGHNLQLVDVKKFVRLRGSRAGHAGKFVVEPEIILDGDRRERLGFLLDGDPFLGLDRLMETVAPAPARHGAAGVFIDDDHLVFLHHILHVANVQAVRLEQLAGDVDGLSL